MVVRRRRRRHNIIVACVLAPPFVQAGASQSHLPLAPVVKQILDFMTRGSGTRRARRRPVVGASNSKESLYECAEPAVTYRSPRANDYARRRAAAAAAASLDAETDCALVCVRVSRRMQGRRAAAYT